MTEKSHVLSEDSLVFKSLSTMPSSTQYVYTFIYLLFIFFSAVTTSNLECRRLVIAFLTSLAVWQLDLSEEEARVKRTDFFFWLYENVR